jgi:hypothetical protein
MSKLKFTQPQKPKSLLVFLTPLVVFVLSFGCEQIFAADAAKEAEKKSAEAKTSFFISTANIVPSNVQPATSGVKLLEGIFLKLRNQPQLAFGNSRAQNLLQAAINPNDGAKDASSATDQLLAIRPAERANSKAMRFDYAPNEFALEHASAKHLAKTAPAQVKPLSTSIQNLAGAAAALQEITQNAEPANIKNYGESARDSARRQSNKTIDARAFTADRGQLVASAPMITEFKKTATIGDFRQAPPGSTPASSFAQLKAAPSLKNEARARSLAMVPPPPPLPALTNAPSGIAGASDSEVAASNVSAASSMAPASPGLYRNIREITKQDKFSNGSGIKEMFDERKADTSDKRQIALLPPSIVSGVPLVHLGASALQIKESLGSKVKIDKQIIEDWTVWSVTGHNRSECALQLYFKHGVVEAIRVFDASYLGPDLGIKLGNDLQTIKEKFGEPAFILPEPVAVRGVEAGKNYIYPISQVSFALARSHDRMKPAPQVVSMLIFNVK